MSLEASQQSTHVVVCFLWRWAKQQGAVVGGEEEEKEEKENKNKKQVRQWQG